MIYNIQCILCMCIYIICIYIYMLYILYTTFSFEKNNRFSAFGCMFTPGTSHGFALLPSSGGLVASPCHCRHSLWKTVTCCHKLG